MKFQIATVSPDHDYMTYDMLGFRHYKVYFHDDRVFAVSHNQYFGSGNAYYPDTATKYFCLEGTWGEDPQTQVVSPEELTGILEGIR